MAIKLLPLLTKPRTIKLGYSVSVDVRPFGYADLKAAEATAFRIALERLQLAADAADELIAGRHDLKLYNERIVGLSEEILIDALVAEFATGWTGVQAVDGDGAAELTPENWGLFRAGMPFLASGLMDQLRVPVQALEREGNG